MTPRHKALLVHLLTATGAVCAMLAILAAAGKDWSLMFLWLVVAFIVDGLDGPLARRYDVATHAPEYDGDLLDAMIDHVTYVFIPAFALFESGLLPGWTGWTCALLIAFTGAIYLSDRRIKTKDKSFTGFPACWNMVILVLFVMEPDFWIIVIGVVVLTAAMFTGLKFVHPIRTQRWRAVTLPVAVVWTASAGASAWLDFAPGALVTALLGISSLYLLSAGIVQQLLPPRGEPESAP